MKVKDDFKRLWILRPGRKVSQSGCRDAERCFMDKRIVGLDDKYEIGDIRRDVRTIEEIRRQVASKNPAMRPTGVRGVVGNVVRFFKEVCVGDFVLCPSRLSPNYFVAVVTSEYRFDKDAEFKHVRAVDWIGTIKKESLSIQAQRELGAARLFFQCRRNSDEVISSVMKLTGALPQPNLRRAQRHTHTK